MEKCLLIKFRYHQNNLTFNWIYVKKVCVLSIYEEKVVAASDCYSHETNFALESMKYIFLACNITV